ncbi:NUDIX hydrolase domain-like protein [Xylariomycetidae sp. FL0641]|nr:NUDIX hydrolase domain-like protein [Xylariomycetidae sp. FL0641]
MPESGQPPAAAPSTFVADPSLSAFQLSLRAFLETRRGLDGIVVGALVFRPEDQRLLLVQRAATDSMPLLWEIPGGATDFEDESILHAAVRELWEETGLRATMVNGLVGPEHALRSRSGRLFSKYSFMMEVEGYDVRLDPEEHQAFLWVNEDEARAKKQGDVVFEYTGDAQEQTVFEGFKAYKTRAKA